MEHVQAELYEHVPNLAVLRLPPRKFPGVLVQGDSLKILWSQARFVLAALEAGELDTEQLDDARDAARELAEALEDRLRVYIDVLDRADIRLPFSRPIFHEQPNEQPNTRTQPDADGRPQQVGEVPNRQDREPETDS